MKFFGACVIWTMVPNNEEYFFRTKEYFKNNLFYFSVILVVKHSPIFTTLCEIFMSFYTNTKLKRVTCWDLKKMWLLKSIGILPILLQRFCYLHVKMYCTKSTPKLPKSTFTKIVFKLCMRLITVNMFCLDGLAFK